MNRNAAVSKDWVSPEFPEKATASKVPSSDHTANRNSSAKAKSGVFFRKNRSAPKTTVSAHEMSPSNGTKPREPTEGSLSPGKQPSRSVPEFVLRLNKSSSSTCPHGARRERVTRKLRPA